MALRLPGLGGGGPRGLAWVVSGPGAGLTMPPALQATRALRELLLEPGRRVEVQAFFPHLFLALLFRISSLLRAEAAQPPVSQGMDPVRYPLSAVARGPCLLFFTSARPGSAPHAPSNSSCQGFLLMIFFFLIFGHVMRYAES